MALLLPLWPGLPGPSLCAPCPLALSPVLCASLLRGHWVCPVLDGAGQQLAAAWFSHSLRVSVPSGWEDFLQGRFPRVWRSRWPRPQWPVSPSLVRNLLPFLFQLSSSSITVVNSKQCDYITPSFTLPPFIAIFCLENPIDGGAWRATHSPWGTLSSGQSLLLLCHLQLCP